MAVAGRARSNVHQFGAKIADRKPGEFVVYGNLYILDRCIADLTCANLWTAIISIFSAVYMGSVCRHHHHTRYDQKIR